MKAPVAVWSQLHEMKEKLNHWAAQRGASRGVGGGGGAGGIFSFFCWLHSWPAPQQVKRGGGQGEVQVKVNSLRFRVQ